MEQIYCLKCKQKTDTKDIEKVITKNNRNMIRGICVVCGTKKNKFIKSAKGEGWTDLPFELHMPYSLKKKYNFLGPGSRLDKRLDPITREPLPHSKPINKIDEVAMNHDLCYEKYPSTKDRNKICDEKMLKDLKTAKTSGLKEWLHKRIAKNIIGAKKSLKL